MKEDFSTLFSALADETRLRILNLLMHREISVHTLTDILGESQPKISRHLAFLRKAGLVTTRREGKWIYYKMAEIKNEHLKKILSNLIAWISNNQKMQKDYQKLLQVQPVTKKILKEENIFSSANMTEIHKRDELEIHLL
jgi:ArsR family transcriptional regulator, arsenate/arsenite/antimonite-responsive transcriptional repressor